MIIILDTNVFGGRNFSESPYFKNLYRFVELTNSEMVLPYVVYREAINLRRQRLLDLLILNNKVEAHSRQWGIPIYDDESTHVGFSDNFISHNIEKYTSLFGPQEKGASFSIVKTSAQEAEEAIDITVNRKPPSKNGDGYRDVLIWLIVKRYLRLGADVAFVTENINDFSDKEIKDNLHRDLQQEVDSILEEHKNRFEYHTSLKTFVEGMFGPTRIETSKIAEALHNDLILEMTRNSDSFTEFEYLTVFEATNNPSTSSVDVISSTLLEHTDSELRISNGKITASEITLTVDMVMHVDGIEFDSTSDAVAEVSYKIPFRCKLKATVFLQDSEITSFDVQSIDDFSSGAVTATGR